MREVAIAAAGMTRFGVRAATFRELMAEAGGACLRSVPGLGKEQIDGVIVGTVMPERTAFQSHISAMAAETLGLRPRKVSARTEHMCASGTVAIRYAYALIKAEMADCILVIGAEKLNVPVKGEAMHNMACGTDRDWEASYGMTAPPAFALAAQAHMRRYGTTEEDFALVSLKNRRNAARNPLAHFNEVPSMDDVMCSRMIADPLRLYHCSPITDGAAAVVVAAEDVAADITDRPVRILGTGQAIDGFSLANLPWEDMSRWDSFAVAAKSAYEAAGIRPEDVDLAEIHDCFSIAEIIAYAELGFCSPGEEAEFLREGRSDYGGDVVVNPRGGLMGCGHPLGATGVAQACEVFWQLRKEAGERQVPDARIAVTHNNSGPGEHAVMVYQGA